MQNEYKKFEVKSVRHGFLTLIHHASHNSSLRTRNVLEERAGCAELLHEALDF